MEMEPLFAGLEQSTLYQLFITLFLILLGLSFRKLNNKVIAHYAERNQYMPNRVFYIRKVSGIILLIIFATAIAIVWDLSLRGLSLYFVSFFTVAGVALFASWSMISNITASLILFFNYPFKIGEVIRIQDGDNSIEGEVTDINLFNIRILTVEGGEVSYPNNLALQKPIINKSKVKDLAAGQ
ncbi:mechanosensitive ion channel domain-containing protein [Algivirga pacifica]|uniref:Mechanosensitive ion channel family protein n=1 Tax=Algivirga pacifica TaxID=1162670 RepID=A0ABP9D5S3_9BACT